jgi:hypothetical protein
VGMATSNPYSQIPEDTNDNQRPADQALFATRASWVVNWFLFFIKFYVVIFSRSKSVIASLVDSAGYPAFHSSMTVP